MKGLRLYKKEKLCSTVAVEQLFMRGSGTSGALDYPLRAVWRSNPRRRSDAPVAFLITVPKKRLRHAVDRVTMRRRIREAYRLQRQVYPMPQGTRIDLAFVYVANRLMPYSAVYAAVGKLLARIQQSVTATPAADD